MKIKRFALLFALLALLTTAVSAHRRGTPPKPSPCIAMSLV